MKKTVLHILLTLIALFGLGRAWGQTADRTVLLRFSHAPFPLSDSTAEQDQPFYDVLEDGRRGHVSPRGGVYWEDATYSDNRVLLSLSPDFDPSRSTVIVVFFHGNQSTLERDVINRQQLPAQFARAGINALLVAPQFAFDALDSSGGRFGETGFFSKFLDETSEQVARWKKNKQYKHQLKKAPVILVAYSGGYLAASYAVERGGAGQRIKGVILLDALYGSEDVFAGWVEKQHKNGFFFSAYTRSTQENNARMQGLLKQRRIKFGSKIPLRLAPGKISFINLGEQVDHHDLMSRAWVQEPLADLMRRIQPRRRHN